jgi:hypothetical protein
MTHTPWSSMVATMTLTNSGNDDANNRTMAETQFCLVLPPCKGGAKDPPTTTMAMTGNALSGSVGFVLSGDGNDHRAMSAGKFHALLMMATMMPTNSGDNNADNCRHNGYDDDDAIGRTNGGDKQHQQPRDVVDGYNDNDAVGAVVNGGGNVAVRSARRRP